MNSETLELVALAASVAGHCQPCFLHHLGKARELGISDEDIRKAVSIANRILLGFAVLTLLMTLQGVYSDVTQQEVRRELGYLEDRRLVRTSHRHTGQWQATQPIAAHTSGDYALAACMVGPGFDFTDFSMMPADSEEAATMRHHWPELAKLI